MKSTIWVQYEHQHEIELGPEEFREWVSELVQDDDGATYYTLSRMLTNIYSVVRDLPDSVLSSIPLNARSVLADGLRRLAERLENGTDLK